MIDLIFYMQFDVNQVLWFACSCYGFTLNKLSVCLFRNLRVNVSIILLDKIKFLT